MGRRSGGRGRDGPTASGSQATCVTPTARNLPLKPVSDRHCRPGPDPTWVYSPDCNISVG